MEVSGQKISPSNQSAKSKSTQEFVALVGSPNSGKTTLFNWLTGRKQKVVNYPGSTVDISLGPVLSNLVESSSEGLTVIDTPGAYSLFPKSQDEEITLRTLSDAAYDIKKVIVVVDSTQISRQVHLVRQVQEMGFQVLVAVTMHDLHVKEKSVIDEKLLSSLLNTPVFLIDGTLGGGVRELVKGTKTLGALADQKIKKLEPWSSAKLLQVFSEGEKIQKQVVKKELSVFKQTENLDRYFLNPLFGPIFFVLIMFGLFSSIYWAAAPLMDLVDTGFAAAIDSAKSLMGAGLLSDLVSDGLIAGLGSVLVFVPQIFILFLGISLLEDSGYLARAATLIDKPLSKVGLNGKAFVPILSGFACAVPAMMAARAINSPKERWIATFIIPLMTCSARLPVYALLIGFVFGGEPLKAGILMATMYIGAVIVGAVAAGILAKLVKMDRPSFFLLELPIYRRPQPMVVIRNSLKRTKAYIVKTGPVILVLSFVLWVLATFPNYQESDSNVKLQTSYAASLGKTLEPVFEPMGVDWRVGVGLISAFAAREVFVSSLAVMFNVSSDDDEDSLREGLLSQMREAKMEDGSPVFTLASVAALLVFFMIALQCISTTAVAKQEMASSRFALTQLVLMNVVAYIAAVFTYSILS